MATKRQKPEMAPRELMKQARRQMTEAVDRLADEVDQRNADAGFHGLLRGMSRLWRYGWFNQMVIVWHYPLARSVMGRRQWEAHGRTVTPNAKPIYILAPKSRTREVEGYPFIIVEVFDVSQTEGPPLPDLKEEPDREAPLERIEAAAGLLGIELKTVLGVAPGHDGGVVAGASVGGRILLDVRLSRQQRAATLIHEYAHELLHRDRRSYKLWPIAAKIRETEAEATCFVVLDALGLRVDAPSYVAWMGGKGEYVRRSMRRIHAAARAILMAIEGRKPVIRVPKYVEPPRPEAKAATRGNSQAAKRRVLTHLRQRRKSEDPRDIGPSTKAATQGQPRPLAGSNRPPRYAHAHLNVT